MSNDEDEYDEQDSNETGSIKVQSDTPTMNTGVDLNGPKITLVPGQTCTIIEEEEDRQPDNACLSRVTTRTPTI